MTKSLKLTNNCSTPLFGHSLRRNQVHLSVDAEGLDAYEDNLPFQNYRILNQRVPTKSSPTYLQVTLPNLLMIVENNAEPPSVTQFNCMI